MERKRRNAEEGNYIIFRFRKEGKTHKYLKMLLIESSFLSVSFVLLKVDTVVDGGD